MSKEAILNASVAIVTAHAMHPTQVVAHFKAVHAAVSEAFDGTAPVVEPDRPAQEPAVPIRKSITPEFMICLEDGKKFKSLKRHLSTAFGLTPDQYREKWGLSRDYPMVAPGYATRRSELAKQMGLGRKFAPASAAA